LVRRHKHAERTVATFAVVIVVAGIVGLVEHSGAAWGIFVGVAMLVVTEWIVWRR
jgi:predicted benzoate:H+ symporter BenE